MRRRRAAGRWWPTISSPPTRAPGWCRPPPPTAPRTWRSGAATAPRCCTRSTRRATSARRPAGCPACTSRPPTRRSSRTCAAAACLPALLALQDGAAVLRADLLVRAHHRGEAAPAGRERQGRLAAAAHPRRPLRRLAVPQRGLGAVPRALLGHAAAAVALRRRPRDGGGEPRRPVGTRRARPLRPGPPPAVRRRGGLRLPGVRPAGPPRARRDRRLVRLGVDAVRPVGLPAPGRGVRGARERGRNRGGGRPRTAER